MVTAFQLSWLFLVILLIRLHLLNIDVKGRALKQKIISCLKSIENQNIMQLSYSRWARITVLGV